MKNWSPYWGPAGFGDPGQEEIGRRYVPDRFLAPPPSPKACADCGAVWDHRSPMFLHPVSALGYGTLICPACLARSGATRPEDDGA